MHSWVQKLDDQIYVQRLPRSFSIEELREFCDAVVEQTASLQEPLTWICDLREVAVWEVDALKRREFAQFNARCEPYDRVVCAGIAFLVDFSPIGQGILTAVFWLSPPVYPYAIVGAPHEALAWCRDALKVFRPPDT